MALPNCVRKKSYVEGGFDPFISGAPVLIIPCTTESAYHRRYQQSDKVDEDGNEIEWPVPYWFMDVGCAVMLILLGVVDEGLAAGYAGAKDLNALRELLGIPAEVTPVGVIPVGHPAPRQTLTLIEARTARGERGCASRRLVNIQDYAIRQAGVNRPFYLES